MPEQKGRKANATLSEPEVQWVSQVRTLPFPPHLVLLPFHVGGFSDLTRPLLFAFIPCLPGCQCLRSEKGDVGRERLPLINCRRSRRRGGQGHLLISETRCVALTAPRGFSVHTVAKALRTMPLGCLVWAFLTATSLSEILSCPPSRPLSPWNGQEHESPPSPSPSTAGGHETQ